jgi:hypothetical protein
MVSVFAIGPKVRGFKPGQGDGFLRAIQIRSTTSFRGEVTPEALCRKILLHSGSINKNTSQGQTHNLFVPFFLLAT